MDQCLLSGDFGFFTCADLMRALKVYRCACMVHDRYWHVSWDRLGGFGVKKISQKMFGNGCLLPRDMHTYTQHTHACIHTCTHACIHIYACIHTQHACTHTHNNTHIMHAYTHMHPHTQTYKHILTCIHRYACMYSYTCTCMHTHSVTCTHTYI